METQTIKAHAKAEGGDKSHEMDLKPEPQKDDAKDKTSLFVGKLPAEVIGKKVTVTIVGLKIEGETFRVEFSSEEGKHGDHKDHKDGKEHKDHKKEGDKKDGDKKKAMGDADNHGRAIAQADNAKEAGVYLKPGGIYTEADIKANGSTTVAEKNKELKVSHDLKPKAGDRLCPVTLTKANPELTWIIGGKKYEFCCPPCVEEFVTLAKTKPEDVKAPETYIKK